MIFFALVSLLIERGESMMIEKLYNDYFRDVHKYIFKMSEDKDLADDITQQTFFKAMHSLSSFRGDCDIKIWLLRIAKNLFYTHKKNEKRFEALPADPIDRIHSVENIVEDRDTVWRLFCSWQELNEPYKEIFSMRVFAELSFDEIGAAFGKNAHWACVTYHRAKEKIKQKSEE